MTVAHPENFPLLERNIPDLCADRVDYALRDFYSWAKDRQSVIAKLSGVVVFKNEFMFKDQYSAEAFANDYLELDKRIWADPKESAIYELLAQAIRHALDKKILTSDDMFTDDETVYYKLHASKDPYIIKKLMYLTPAFRIEEATPEQYHLHVQTKIRYVDPKIVVGKTTRRLSTLSPKYKTKLEQHIKTGKQGWYVNVYQN